MTEIERAINFFTSLKFQYADTAHVLKRCDVAIAALTEQAARINPKPLTLDELRERDGKPVYVHDDDEMGFGGWGIVRTLHNKIYAGDDDGYFWDIEYTFNGTCGFSVYDYPIKEDKPID